MAAHAVRRSRIEAVVPEEPARRIGREDLPVEEHGHAVGVPGAEFHIMRHHDDRDALPFQIGEDRSKRLLEEAVDALCRLVEQQELRLGEQHLGERRALLLAAGEIVGVALERGVI